MDLFFKLGIMLKITRAENIPFREADWSLMQMIQSKVEISVTQREDENEKDLEDRLDETFSRELDKVLANDNVYQKQKRQLAYLVDVIKKELPTKARDVILKAKEI